MTSEDQEEIRILKQHLQTLRERVSRSRKEGMDTRIVEIKLMNIMPKIMMAKVTNTKEDMGVVANLLADLEREMKQLRKEQRFEDILRQVAEEERHQMDKEDREKDYVQLSQEEIISKTNKLINQAREHLDKKEFEKVYPIYLEVQGIYRYLPKELKQRVFNDSMLIYNRLRSSGIFKRKSKWEMLLKKIGRRFGK